jgi:signal transduction histidine kinase
MRKKLLTGMILFSLISVIGGLYIISSIERATAIHKNIVTLHQAEILREHLLIQIKKVQADLTLKGTRHERDINTIVSHVSGMGRVVATCFDCHHNERMTRLLVQLHDETNRYKNALSRVFTFRANTKRLAKEEDAAFKIGEKLIEEVNSMIALTTKILNEKTEAAFREINSSRRILTFFILAGPVIAIGLAILFYRSFTRPIFSLLSATKKLKSGDLDYRVETLKDEFGMVAASFNEMAESLKDQMQKMQRAEQMVVIGEMAAGLAHEIKNPLAGIKASIETLKSDLTLEEEDRDILSRVIDEIKRIETLMRSMLSFARPPKPQFDLLEIGKVLDSAITNAGYSIRGQSLNSANSNNIQFVKDYDGNLPPILADPSQLQQVFLNLMLNAVETMPEGGTVRVKTFHDIGNNAVQVEISDTGPGLGEEIIDKIFTPFYTTKRRGTGLGLAICKRLVEQHGGTMSAGNDPEGGAKFTIILPVEQEREVREG